MPRYLHASIFFCYHTNRYFSTTLRAAAAATHNAYYKCRGALKSHSHVTFFKGTCYRSTKSASEPTELGLLELSVASSIGSVFSRVSDRGLSELCPEISGI